MMRTTLTVGHKNMYFECGDKLDQFKEMEVIDSPIESMTFPTIDTWHMILSFSLCGHVFFPEPFFEDCLFSTVYFDTIIKYQMAVVASIPIWVFFLFL